MLICLVPHLLRVALLGSQDLFVLAACRSHRCCVSGVTLLTTMLELACVGIDSVGLPASSMVVRQYDVLSCSSNIISKWIFLGKLIFANWQLTFLLMVQSHCIVHWHFVGGV